MRRPRVTVLYHYFHPDDVVSARHYDDFCKGLVGRGWDVEAMPCIRGCRDERRVYPQREVWCGVAIRRVWRPCFRQASNLGRLLNAVWMIFAWSLLLVTRSRHRLPDVLVIGTDPVLSVCVAWVVKRLRPSVRVVHWCYDLYPEAAVAEGMLGESSILTSFIKRLTGSAYRSCDLLVDIGGCMRRLLGRYNPPGRQVTLVPWALSEPGEVVGPEPSARRELFGDAALGLLYSGNFGRAHSYEELLELARRLRGEPIRFCFGVRGNQAAGLRAAVRADDTNVSFAGFAPEEVLARRLGAADIHLISLHPSWTGVVVPSKFFGSLAAGRPVLFAGSRDAAIAQWIREHRVGWVLDRETLPQIAEELRRLTTADEEMRTLRLRCHEVYHAHFSWARTMERWNSELRAFLTAPVRASLTGMTPGANGHLTPGRLRASTVDQRPIAV
jgi:colanic acid biosynthesis glycosyl transferase WcaI